MAFVKAVRQKVYMKALLTGPSGSGKSMSALELATGMAKAMQNDGVANEGIAYIGTEGDRDLLYAQQNSKHGGYTLEYDLLQIEDPYTTDKYIAAINDALKSGYKCILIDGLSAEWKWLNDTHDKMPGNSFTNWGKLKPKHRELIDKILTAEAHIICCARGKDEWLLEDKNGKQVPKKVGVGSQTDKDISYEMMLSLQIDQETHLAHADKDNTGLWPETRYTTISAEDGEMLYKWCQNGVNPTARPKVETPTDSSDDELKTIKNQIVSKCKELGGQSNAGVMALMKEYGNPNAIKELSVAQELLEKLNNI